VAGGCKATRTGLPLLWLKETRRLRLKETILPSEVVVRSCKTDGGIPKAVLEVMEALRWNEVIKPNAKVVIKPNLCTKRPALIRAATPLQR